MSRNRVFWYVPNIIGYIRIIFYLASFLAHYGGNWQLFLLFYVVGFILDEFDGRAARAFNQSSNFGAALDMVCDRCATAGICLILAQLYPAYSVVFIVAIALDISSHYYLIYATARLGKASHKDSADWSENSLLRLYYGNKSFMDLLILGNELFYILLYFAYYGASITVAVAEGTFSLAQIALYLCLPIYLLKQVTNVVQLQSAAKQIASLDAERERKTD